MLTLYEILENQGILGLRHFFDFRPLFYRNSYRCLIYHIYEVVKLNQIKMSNQFNYSESEKTFKAFIEHGLAWTLIVQSYFL